ncbi:uncharacterized protein CANTADRAFT_46981 [Suhomyces tanzawaensis NRRL Y-17324]|uniref:Sfi1 spindle body domain-containing protein n=1 Tax=Suhomyces tanzawaensis NRRL Y-17324 TaxID=984487 RepID=A0A1E4SM81_9ASCO|nr:uncharacterized protein CANTADRAFT_46981 [Suhomyces tanzawaensis NRRL Y-17324]ODV80595.1 hypothetical protein CANTADRAFT_46981 [Suhomyces tanzawaensis NRRL Y-17324]
MSDPLPDLLHKTLKNLHQLHTHQDHHTYEPLLRESIANVIQVINYNDKSYNRLRLNSTSSSQSDASSTLDILYYSPSDRAINSLTNVNIVQFIQSFNQHEVHSNHSVLELLVELLSKIKGKRPIRIKDSYSLIFGKLSTLIQFFIKFQADSESMLVDFIQRCAMEELRFYSSIQSQLDSLDEQDTQNIADFLDSIILNEVEDEQNEQDSIFSYENDHQPVTSLQKFLSSDPDLDYLYGAFLKILSFKSPLERDYKNYIRIMINLFKRHANVEFMEVDSFEYKEMKLNQVLNFFMSDSEGFRILPELFKDVNSRVFSEPTLNHPYSKEDQIRLYNNLRHIIPLLNEFDLNFNNKFPSMFRYYLKLMYEDLPTLSVSSDLKFVDTIVHLVNSIVDYENEEDTEDINIKQSVTRFHGVHLKLSSTPGTDATLLMRLAASEYNNHASIKRLAFANWSKKFLNVQTLWDRYHTSWAQNENKQIQKAQLQKWFGKRLLFNTLEVEASKYYENVLLDKKFKSEWYQKLSDHRELTEIANNAFLKRYFISWSNGAQRMKQLQAKAQRMDQITVQSSVFVQLKRSHNHKIELQKIAKSLADKFTLSRNEQILVRFWNLWHQKLPIEHELGENKLAILFMLERKWIQTRFFKIWKQMHDLEKGLKKSQVTNNTLLLTYVFENHWKRKLVLSQKANAMRKSKEVELKRQIFYHWKAKKGQIELADSVQRNHLLKSALRQWKLNNTLRVFQQNSEHSVIDMKNCLKKWLLKYKLHNSLRRKDLDIQDKILTIWTARKDEKVELARRSHQFERYSKLQDSFTRWLSATKDVMEYEATADLNFQRKFYNKIIQQHHLIDYQLNRKADKFLATGVFDEHFITAMALSRWKSKYGDRFESKLLLKIASFEQKMRNPNLLSLMIRQWVNRYNEKQAKLNELDERYAQFVRKARSKKQYFSVWNQKTNAKLILLEEAVSFQNSVLLKKFLLIWYDQYINKGVYLGEVADNLIDNKQFQQVQSLLSRWSMKYMKLIQRNNQSCDMFLEKWQNAKLRSIFELWLVKLREAKDNLEDFQNADTSMISNHSPLANKSSRTNTRSEEDPNSSYLFTPLKQQVHGRLLFTPKTNRISPTKLQETNQRIKNERIDALRKHFGRAKGTSTPRSNISTPKKNTGNDLRVISPSRHIEKDEKTVIENAKKLRRITPIMFPTEEEGSQPKFSPVKKLRERLRNNLITVAPSPDDEYSF